MGVDQFFSGKLEATKSFCYLCLNFLKITPRKKTSLGESLAKSRAYNPIRDSGETLGEREMSREESCRESQ